jgi:hypothetical protein
VNCRGSNGVGGEGGASCAEISGAGNGRPGGGVGNGKVVGGVGNSNVAGAGVSSGLSGVAVVTEVVVEGRMDRRFGG